MLAKVDRREVLFGSLAVATSSIATRAQANFLNKPFVQFTGINLPSGAFGALPGVHERDYIYADAQSLGYYRSLGFNLARLAFRWERLQPEMDQALSNEELNRIASAVQNAINHGVAVILNPHNYARRRISDDGFSQDHLISSARVPVSSFCDFWSRLAFRFKSSPEVFFGIMNEPHGISANDWLNITNQAITAIRSQGAKNLILVPGVGWSSALNWIDNDNAVMKAVEDPAKNFLIEVHQYLDSDASGTHGAVVSKTIGVERLISFQDWARSNGFRAFLGEFGAGSDPDSCAALKNICHEMAQNSDVWAGWSIWAGGPWLPADYPFNLEPYPDGRPKEQISSISAYTSAPQ